MENFKPFSQYRLKQKFNFKAYFRIMISMYAYLKFKLCIRTVFYKCQMATCIKKSKILKYLTWKRCVVLVSIITIKLRLLFRSKYYIIYNDNILIETNLEHNALKIDQQQRKFYSCKTQFVYWQQLPNRENVMSRQASWGNQDIEG